MQNYLFNSVTMFILALSSPVTEVALLTHTVVTKNTACYRIIMATILLQLK